MEQAKTPSRGGFCQSDIMHASLQSSLLLSSLLLSLLPSLQPSLLFSLLPSFLLPCFCVALDDAVMRHQTYMQIYYLQ